MERYIEKLAANVKPRNVLVCMTYYPVVQPTLSWAPLPLSAMCHGRDPSRLKRLISGAYEEVTW
jgi:hypothetical protein